MTIPDDDLLRRMFDAVTTAAQPATCVPPHLPDPPVGRTVVVGAGKATAAMAQAVEIHWPGPLEGVVVTRYGHAVSCDRIRVLEAGHPVPDQASLDASHAILDAVRDLSADDLVLVLISGGASALMTLPVHDVDLEEKIAINKYLLNCGATIRDINCVRKHLSCIKGGWLARAAHPARLVTLAISDVPGDDPSVIGSGPTVPDPTTFKQARGVLQRFGVNPPEAVAGHLSRGAIETPKPGDPVFSNTIYHLVAAPAMALEGAATVARAEGFDVTFLGDALEGEAREVARAHAELVRTLPPGTVLLSGGELTVTIRGDGKGGPNTEYMLALAAELDGMENVSGMACDTDGSDGIGGQAGARFDPTTLDRARRLGLDPKFFLEGNDSAGFFAALGDLVVTGPTHTNVNDFRAIVVRSP